jgi:hypothetical protein
LNAAVPEISL